MSDMTRFFVMSTVFIVYATLVLGVITATEKKTGLIRKSMREFKRL